MIRSFRIDRLPFPGFSSAVLGINPLPLAVNVVLPLMNLFEKGYV
jgi:hypothetical protein